jgi:hypothetical protein
MNTYNKTVHRFLKFLLIVSLANACTVESSGSTSSTVSENPLLTENTPTEENLDLQTANFDGIVIKDTVEGLPVYIGSGSVPNNQGETLQITAAGTSDSYVIDYFKTAKFYFEIRETSIPLGPNVSPIQMVNFSLSEALSADKANLLITIDLPSTAKEKYPKGTVFVEVDPVLGQNQQHIYLPTDPSTNQVDVEVTSQQGAVEGSLYLQNVGLMDTKKTQGPNIPEIISGVGNGIFDFVVSGLEIGNNEYRLRGNWSYGITDPAPNGPISITPTSITFESFPDGTPIIEDLILVGNEYLSRGIFIKPWANNELNCNDHATAIRIPTMDVPYYFLTSSSLRDPLSCNKGQIDIYFINPVREVTISFYHADSDYVGLWGFDKDGTEVVTEILEDVETDSTGKLTIISENANITRVIFGQIDYLVAITEIYFVP